MKKILQRLFLPNIVWGVFFYPGWIILWFMNVDEWKRNWDNFFNWTIAWFAFLIPFYLFNLDESNRGFLDRYRWYHKLENIVRGKKWFTWVFLIGYLFFIFFVISRFSLQ